MRLRSSNTTHEEGDVSLEGQVVLRKDTFRYLGSMLDQCCREMKMLAAKLKKGGGSGVKHLMCYVTSGYHKS
jgi:hypothetical protein